MEVSPTGPHVTIQRCLLRRQGSNGGGKKSTQARYWYDPRRGAAAIQEGGGDLGAEGVDMPREPYDMKAERTESNDRCPEKPATC